MGRLEDARGCRRPEAKTSRLARIARGVTALSMLGALVTQPSCDHGIDTRREAGPTATLGDDIYGLLCDRLGASTITEDLTGASYHDVCHFDEDGVYGNEVDTSVLPTPSTDAAREARRLSVAKLERMAAHRTSLVRAFNAAFPDRDIPNVATDDPDDTIPLGEALLRFSQDITPLYESNPFESDGEPLMPGMSDAFGRLFETLEDSEPARAALMRIAARQGYRPAEWGLGGIRSSLAYPSLRPFLQAQLDVLGPDGSATAELQAVLSVAKRELLTIKPEISALEPYRVAPSTLQPNRARTGIEFAQDLMLDEAPVYAPSTSAPARFIARRGKRGFAVPLGNEPGVSGTVPAPFADADGDGFADVDGFGRFVDGGGLPLPVSAPFVLPGEATPADPWGRPEGSPYAYIDTTQTLLSSLSRDLVALNDATRYAPEDDPEPWRQEHEAVMYAMAGLPIVAGAREEAQYDHAAEAVVPAGQACPITAETNPITGEPLQCSTYSRYRGEASPLAKLVHAAGQVLAHPDSDVILRGVAQLVEEHPDVVARVLGALLQVDAIAEGHDELAAAGMEPKAELAYEVPIYDEMAQVLNALSQHPGLVAKLLVSFTDPVLVQSHTQPAGISGPPSAHFGETLAAFMRYRDAFTYDPNDVNGVAINLTEGGGSLANPRNLVDRNQPLRGDNRSLFERTAQLIYDGKDVKACNKQGAKVATGVGSLLWPLTGSYDECELFEIDDIGAFFLDANLPTNHPKKSELVIKSGVLDALLNFIGGFTSKDAFLESASGIVGMTTRPSPPALNRLLFYGAESDQYGLLPDYDSLNAGSDIDDFVRNAVEPVAPVVCAEQPSGVHRCSNNRPQDVLRLRDRGTIFAWERLGFLNYLRPTLQVFAELSCNESVTQCDTDDITGEGYFLELTSVLWRHWPGPDHGDYCDSDAAKSDPRYCSGAGVNRYEPILADAFASDLIPALHAFAVAVNDVEVTYQRGPRQGQTISGPEVIELLVQILFDQQYAAQQGMADLNGSSSATWTDGTTQAQLTPFNLFADALHDMDVAFAQSDAEDVTARQSQWKRARSLLVDQLLAVEGTGSGTQFENPAFPRMMTALVGLLREQINANCPQREFGGGCAWAERELGQDMADFVSSPLFASAVDLFDQVRSHEPARREMGRFLSYVLSNEDGLDAITGMLASLSDVMQLLQADADLAPILNAASVAAHPGDDAAGAGCADRTLRLLRAMSSDDYDRYHVLDHVLPNLVTPMADGWTPMQVIADAMADINRTDASLDTPFDAEDYRFVMRTMKDFMSSDTRGVRQLYYIVQNRKKD